MLIGNYGNRGVKVQVIDLKSWHYGLTDTGMRCCSLKTLHPLRRESSDEEDAGMQVCLWDDSMHLHPEDMADIQRAVVSDEVDNSDSDGDQFDC